MNKYINKEDLGGLMEDLASKALECVETLEIRTTLRMPIGHECPVLEVQVRDRKTWDIIVEEDYGIAGICDRYDVMAQTIVRAQHLRKEAAQEAEVEPEANEEE